MLPKRIFSSSKAILMITSVNKNTGRFIFIGAVVADRGTFCYYKSGQRLLQVGAAIQIGADLLHIRAIVTNWCTTISTCIFEETITATKRDEQLK